MHLTHKTYTHLTAIIMLFFLFFSITPQATASSIFGEFTVRDEIKLGKEFDKMVHSKLPIVLDPQVTDYIKHLVARIASQMPPQPFPITASVIQNNAMNAFAVPGGYIYIYTGLILNMKHESELAAVIGHELAHVSLRHVARRMEKMKLVNMASVLGTLAGMLIGMSGGSNSANIGQALAVGSMAGGQSAYLSYTQSNEREADHLGMNYMISAGFNPEGMVNSFKTMKQRQWYVSNVNIPTYLSTHPGLDTRIDYLKERFLRMPPEYFKRQNDDADFFKIQTLIRARMTDPKIALAHYNNIPVEKRTCLDHLGQGIILSRMKKYQEAEVAFTKAHNECPGETLILREEGRFYFTIGKMDKASPLLHEAYIRDSKDAMTLFFIARVEAARKDYKQAILTMRRVAEMVPEDQEIHYHLGRMLGESGNYFEAHVQLAYAALYGHNGKQAKFHLKKAEGLAKTATQRTELSKLQETITPKPPEEKKQK
ncbi:M48 family metallopeptidase [Maridesulfovibrio zosterae]|uniref:beta-barrel assembly-enhancing protease n=1 Tax=Maridesulfovibrio zosterae TaxID=82171 RepID=UPI00047F5195|nr:M48 family metallopeptidase [Maridesulfovibrio zosterae]